jgi:hypothetical protein
MPAVWLAVDPEGMRVEHTAVVDVRPDGDGWTVETLAGTEHVDERGEGRQLVPLDAEMAAEFEERGTSYVVRSTVDDLEHELDHSYDWQRFERDLSIERGDERDLGHER